MRSTLLPRGLKLVIGWKQTLGAFGEFSLLVIISAFAGGIALVLRQPVLIAYIVVGIVVGPAVLGIVHAHEQIELLAQIGVSVLLFVVGLKLDLKHIRHTDPSH